MSAPSIGNRIRSWLWPLVYRVWGETIDALAAERSTTIRVHHGDSESYYRAYNTGFADGVGQSGESEEASDAR